MLREQRNYVKVETLKHGFGKMMLVVQNCERRILLRILILAMQC